MRKIIPIVVLAFLLGVVSQSNGQAGLNTLTKKEVKEGWRLLFDGQNPSQWRSVNKETFPEKGWSVKEGCMVSGGGGSIVSRTEYGNFDLSWEWKMMDAGGNSGVKYFVKEGPKDALGIEYQMLDDEGHPWMKDGRMKPFDYHTNGAVYEIYPTSPEKINKPVGEWNTSRVLSKGNNVQHWLNGVKIAEYVRGSDDFKAQIAKSKFKDVPNFGLHEKGLLMLTDHGSVVYFKNLKIREL